MLPSRSTDIQTRAADGGEGAADGPERWVSLLLYNICRWYISFYLTGTHENWCLWVLSQCSFFLFYALFTESWQYVLSETSKTYCVSGCVIWFDVSMPFFLVDMIMHIDVHFVFNVSFFFTLLLTHNEVHLLSEEYVFMRCSSPNTSWIPSLWHDAYICLLLCLHHMSLSAHPTWHIASSGWR